MRDEGSAVRDGRVETGRRLKHQTTLAEAKAMRQLKLHPNHETALVEDTGDPTKRRVAPTRTML
jgi:hypothetical protein